MLGCIDELESIPECLRYLWRESLIERPGCMGVQVIHHQCNFLGPSVTIINRLEESSPILSGSSLSNLYHPSPGKRFTCEEDAACAAAAIFIIVSGRLSWWTGDRYSAFADGAVFGDSSMQTTGYRGSRGRLYMSRTRSIWATKSPSLLRRDHPRQVLPGFEFVFLKLTDALMGDGIDILEFNRSVKPVTAATIANTPQEAHCSQSNQSRLKVTIYFSLIDAIRSPLGQCWLQDHAWQTVSSPGRSYACWCWAPEIMLHLLNDLSGPPLRHNQAEWERWPLSARDVSPWRWSLMSHHALHGKRVTTYFFMKKRSARSILLLRQFRFD